MNAIRQAQYAYRQDAQTVKTPRSTEYDAFARITQRLKSALPGERFADLAGAIHDNRSLWTILAADVADKGNPLPKELKARIIYLAEFTHLHSSKVLTDGAPVTPLVEINTAIMSGLRDRRPKQ